MNLIPKIIDINNIPDIICPICMKKIRKPSSQNMNLFLDFICGTSVFKNHSIFELEYNLQSSQKPYIYVIDRLSMETDKYYVYINYFNNTVNIYNKKIMLREKLASLPIDNIEFDFYNLKNMELQLNTIVAFQ